LWKAVVINNPDNEKFVAGTETTIMRILDKNKLFPKFLNYILMTYWYLKEFKKSITWTKVYRVHPRMISKIKIPIPSLEKQKEIVEILDKFDKLVNDISEGLPAEIEARRKQYEYYRGKLLEFEERK